jgi:hypothetical protein
MPSTNSKMRIAVVGVISVVLFSFVLIPTIFAAASSSPQNTDPIYGVIFSFKGTSKTSDDIAKTNGHYGSSVAGSGQVSDKSGMDGFAFKLSKFESQNSVCSRSSAVNLNGIVTRTWGNGLRAHRGISLAVLLKCDAKNSITIVLPACSAGVPQCLVAPIYSDTFFGVLKLLYA